MKILLITNISIFLLLIIAFVTLYIRVQIKQKIEFKIKQAEATKIKYENKINSKRPTPTVDYDTLMGILNSCIENEFRVTYLTDLSLTNQVIISDFESDLRKLSTGVIEAFSKEYLEDLTYYYSTEYIVSYVTRVLKIKLMAYVREHRIGIK